MGLLNGVNNMYKEKLINYINKSDGISFIINLPEENQLLEITFSKEADGYFCTAKPCKQNEDKKYEYIEGEIMKDNLNDFPEDVLKIFVNKWEQMILEQYIDK